MGEATSLADRKRRAGQRLLLTLPAHGLDDDLRALAGELQPGGFVLPAAAAQETEQLWELGRELRSLVSDARPPVVAARHGGAGARLLGATDWPPLRWVGNVGDLRQTEALGAAWGAELRAWGVDLWLAEVADVDQLGRDGVVGEEAFGGGPREVARQVAALVRGARGAGVGVALGPFPGRGGCRAPEPVAEGAVARLPWVDKEREELWHEDLLPFRAGLEPGAAAARAVLLGLVEVPALEEGVPACMNGALVRGQLRERAGHTGLVLAAGFEDARLRARHPLEARASAVTEATVDLVELPADLHAAVDAFEAFVRLQEEDPAQDDLAEDSERRLRRWREAVLLRRPPPPPPGTVGGMAHKHLALGLVGRGRP